MSQTSTDQSKRAAKKPKPGARVRTRPGRPRVIVVAKVSSLARLEHGQGDLRARKLLTEENPVVRKWRPAHEAHVRTVDAVLEALESLGAETLVLHGAHAEFDARRSDLVVTVGGDGTLLAASHSVARTPILGVNSAPKYSVGFFCGAASSTVKKSLAAALEGKMPQVELSRMALAINGHIRSDRILNEALFCQSEPAATSEYILRVGRAKEEQKSSGFWVGPPAGSTAAIRSAGGKILPLTPRCLQLVIREPYLGHGRQMNLLREVVSERGSVVAVSKMSSARVCLDGPYRVLSVRLGDEVRFSTSPQPLTVLGLSKKR